MHRVLLNRLRLDLRLDPATPLLIKSGDKGIAMLHPELPDITFVRTGPPEDETVYVPGASLKGVFRSSAERVLRSIEKRCCDPLDHKGGCQDAASKKGDEIARTTPAGPRDPFAMGSVFRMLCYACRTFGSQAVASRVAFADAYPPREKRRLVNRTERRSGVAIDRKTGGPSRGKLFDMEIVTAGPFETSIHMENVQLWQVALLGFVLRDIDAGFVRLGSGKSRGLGRVRIGLNKLVFEQTDPAGRIQVPAGLAALDARLVEPYDLLPAEPDRLPDAAGATVAPTALGPRFSWDGDAAWRMLDGCAGAPWRGFVANGER